MKSKYKIVIIDDDELAVDNLVFELKSYPHFSIEGIARKISMILMRILSILPP